MSELLVIENAVIVSMNRNQTVYENGAVVIQGNKILDVGNSEDIVGRYKADQIIDGEKKLVLPGLIDLHVHSALTRGISDALPLEPYLTDFWYPLNKSLKPEEAYAAALLTYGEAIKSGCTCVNDQYRHMIQCSEAAERIGIRAILSSNAADDSEGLDTLHDNEQLVLKKNGAANGRIQTRFGVEWVPISSIEFLTKVKELAEKYEVGVNIHLNESLGEIELAKKRHGKRPIELAHDLGILGPNCIAVHCVWVTDREIEMLRYTGTSVAHAPGSNSKLGVGISPIIEMINAGINIGLGHDSVETNNSGDMFEAMKLASVLQRASRADSSVMPPEQVLEMATVNGAKALGVEKEIGSIEPGKKADIIIVDLNKLRLTPVVLGPHFNLYSHLVYATHGDDVDTVIIDGRIVMKNRKLVYVKEEEIINNAQEAVKSVIERFD
ncbi:MAG: amidohydrolase [Candidatus Thorarchaeota archaeon]